ncbi:hypothetical protein LB534_03465 [Mesorhizobium sp. CA18]|uniref:DUF768 domain-containing protein n=1 Tax=unclassified Mesorhizobium TaxID=325217 RepID=UPI001CCD7A3E|nr:MULTISPECIES: hypothetical protein [unclassified Mesorhizobium]MBZ9733670.1 hypothetical protein [Mesorhizobium sp. CA9]MBZ9824335.1 hypothetical protein [Mesorhizobium sp. CA18]MBZ9831179.1 hypothetical protein [Mesorhizobium sp. CA2]MBZ9837343.1 hypothetical protein [Mesorhizobium sp. CA3]MBZ9877373.1 hypothetical protein [Mesorhizobium sp. Ca11]
MSTRGINFLDKWMAEHLPNAMTDDPMAVSDLADEMMKGAERERIPASEIHEEVDSVFGVIFEAMHHREGSLPEAEKAVLDQLAARLAREAGISDDQAGELLKRIGTDWDSLLNEAHFLKELEGRLEQE